MGLDTVEIVMKVEETFCVDLPQEQLDLVVTVGDLYHLLLGRLNLSCTLYPVRRSIVPVPIARESALAREKNNAEPSQEAAQLKRCDEAEVWQVLREIIVNQLQVDPEDVVPEAHLGRDLGCD